MQQITKPKHVHLKKDELLIFEAQSEVNSLFIIQSGELEISRMGPKERIVLSHAGPGEVIGEISAIDGQPRSATVKGITDCTLIEIPKKILDSIIYSQPEWFQMMIKGLANRLRRTNLKVRH